MALHKHASTTKCGACLEPAGLIDYTNMKDVDEFMLSKRIGEDETNEESARRLSNIIFNADVKIIEKL